MRWLTSLPYSRKLTLAIYLPILVISVCSVLLIIASHHRSNYQQLFESVEQISEQVANASEYALLFNDKSLLGKNIDSLLQHPSIVGATFFDGLSRRVESAGNDIEPGQFIPALQTEQRPEQQLFIVTAPVYYTISQGESLLGLQASTTDNNIVGWLQIAATYTPTELVNLRFTLFSLGICLVFNLVALILSRRLAQHLSTPWLQLKDAVDNIYQENFGYSQNLVFPLEFAQTKEALDYIDSRLANYQAQIDAEIEQQTRDLNTHSEELEEKSAELHFANKQAEESNKLKSEFLANISHEIRTPLSAILGFTEVLRNSPLTAEQLSHINTIQLSTRNLLTTIGDILDFAKLESGKLLLEQREFNLHNLINEVFHALSSSLLNDSKDLEFVCDYAADTPEWILADDGRFRQILMNLIGNAIKFTNKGYIQVDVSTKTRRNRRVELLIQVRDTGVGIANDEIGRLFRPFSQVDARTTRKFGGTGLGLVISKELVKQMRGEITVSSSVGRGTNFYFTVDIPVAQRAPTPIQPINKKLFIFEPAHICHRSLAHHLGLLNIDAHWFTDGKSLVQALQAKSSAQPDALLLSTSSRIVSENELLALVQYCQTVLEIPCVLMGHTTSPSFSIDRFRPYTNAFISKPFSTSELSQALTEQALPTLLNPQSASPAPTLKANSRIKGLSILAVDDTQVNLHLVRHWLTPHGIELDLAYDGLQAVERAKEKDYDLILMDIQMPQMDGIEATLQIRQLPGHIETPIIALTAHALGDEKKRIIATGMNDYLTKPITEEVLFKTIEHWCFGEDSHDQAVARALEGIFDYQKALTMTNQNHAIAKDLFTMMVEGLPHDWRMIQLHYEQGNLDELISAVHKLHGASKYTGTIGITKHANYLETHLKEFGFEDVEEVYNDFIAAIQEFEQAIPLVQWPQQSQTPEHNGAHR